MTDINARLENPSRAFSFPPERENIILSQPNLHPRKNKAVKISLRCTISPGSIVLRPSKNLCSNLTQHYNSHIMFRCGSLLALSGFLLLSDAAFALNTSGFCDFFSPNTTIAHRQFASESVEQVLPAPGFLPEHTTPADSITLAPVRILMFDYASYDSIYAAKVESMLRRNLPNARIRAFWSGTAGDLETALIDRQVVVMPYPSNGDSDALQAYGAVLKNFVRAGGSVIFTGTHEYDVLRQLGLFDLDYAYYFADPVLQRPSFEHAVTAGLPTSFSLTNYAYPLEVSDPDFVSLADVNGYSSVGYKMLGKGSAIYLGLEYYYEEAYATRLLLNSIAWGNKLSKAARAGRAAANPNRPRRLTLRLAPHEIPAKDSIGLKIFPNPFVDRADIELAVGEPTPISIEINDQMGNLVAVMLSRKTLAQGKHVLELPNLPPGVYFVKCKSGELITVRRVVKIAAP